MVIANGSEIICQGGVGNNVPQIRECVIIATPDFMSPFRDILNPCPIDPGNGGGHQGKVQVIHDGMSISGLAFTAADVLFDLFEAGFDFPSCAIVFDDLFGSQIEIGRDECDPLCFTKDPDDPDRSFERFEHDYFCSGQDLAVVTVEKHTMA